MTATKTAELKKKATTTAEDTGSPSAQITAMTARVNELTEHLKVNKKDHMARRGLLVLVGRRKRLLKYLVSKDSGKYLELIKKLGLRR